MFSKLTVFTDVLLKPFKWTDVKSKQASPAGILNKTLFFKIKNALLRDVRDYLT